MPRGKKSPVKRKTRKTSPRRRVSPKRRVRKTSPTSKTRKTSRGRKKMSTGGSINREYVDFGPFPSSRHGNYGGGSMVSLPPLPPDPVRRIGPPRLPPLPPDPVRRIGPSRLPPLPPDPVRMIGSSRRTRQRGVPSVIEVPGGDLITFSRQTAARYARDGFPVVYTPGDYFLRVADYLSDTYIVLPDGDLVPFSRQRAAMYASEGYVLQKYSNAGGHDTYRLKYVEE